MSSSQNLIWDDYSKDIESGFCEIYRTGLLHDVTLTTEGKKINAHKLVLALSSQHFKDLFSDNSSQNQQTIVFVSNVSFHALKILVEFMYTGEVTVPEDLLDDVMKGAQVLDIKALIGKSTNNAEQNLAKRSKRVSRIPFRYQSDDKQTKKHKLEEIDSNPPYVDMNGSEINFGQTDMQIQMNNEIETACQNEESEKLDLNTTDIVVDEVDQLPDVDVVNIKTEEEDKESVPTTTNNTPTSLKYIRNKNGNFCLVVNDHIYMRQATHKDRIFWRCQMHSKMGCKSRCVTVGNVIMKKVAIHSHAPQTDRVIECEIKGDIVYM